MMTNGENHDFFKELLFKIINVFSYTLLSSFKYILKYMFNSKFKNLSLSLNQQR